MSKISENKKVYHYIATVSNVEIRKVEENSFSMTTKEGEKEYKNITLHCDDENGDRIFFKDKIENAGRYHRGQVGTFKIRIDCEEEFGIQCKVTVIDFIEDKPEEEEPKPTKGKAKR